jgi:hypothetical protein
LTKSPPIIKNQAVNLQTNGGIMRQRHFIFLVVCLLMFCGKNFGQKFPQKKFPQYPRYNLVGLKIETPRNSHYFKNSVQDYLLIHLQAKPGFVVNDPYPKFQVGEYEIIGPPFNVVYPPAIPKDFYINGLGMICRYELKFETKTSIPLRLRLGSLEYVNYLEQKPNSRW